MNYIHCLNNISAQGTDLLTNDYELTDNIEAAQGILVRSAGMLDMEFSENLLAIARAGAGVNNIPLERCAEEGIVVFNTPGANANAVKELVLCGMLLASRGIVGGIEWCKENAEDPVIGKTAEKAKKQFAGREIKGKTLGVIGLGAIGAEVANAALGLGMEVMGYDPFVSVNAAWKVLPAVQHVTDLADIYRECDYITIHVPAVNGTIGMIDEAACALMKEGVVFLNFSRDTLVDASAMASALASGKVGCYVTDFATPEVMAMENAIVLPHLGASTEEAEDNCARMAVVELMDYIDNGNIVNSVNYPACQAGVCPDDLFRIAVLYNSSDLAMGSVTEILEPIVAEFDMVDNQRDEHGYALITLTENLADEVLERIAELDGAYLVRRVK
ncbi:MAG: 3-phosphoglycerate dehydrogenase [Eggerthella sp.]|nr:3-phosphoglycerate dehydrogenase [Eggerthella sp.]MBS6247672.1 3-phosphoglycerate dehydrogenase [Eggerthella sp.]